MVYPPGQGKSGEYLMHLWRQYLEQYAEHEGEIEDQIIVGAYHAVEVLGFFSRVLDREGRCADLIEERIRYFHEGSGKARVFVEHILNASFGLYNHVNSLSRQFASGNSQAVHLVEQIEARVYERISRADPIESSAAAVRAAFPLLSLMTLIIDRGGAITPAIRQLEQRFAACAAVATSDFEHLANGLYRIVEMMQLFVVLSDAELRSQVDQIATRFQEEDKTTDLRLKMRNGFCRLFELSHLLATHIDGIL